MHIDKGGTSGMGEGEGKASRAGKHLANGIVESVHLMYQNNTALRFLRSLITRLNREINRRELNALEEQNVELVMQTNGAEADDGKSKDGAIAES